MAISPFPFESADTSEDQYSRLMSEAIPSGIVGSPGDNAFLVVPAPTGMGVVIQAPTGGTAAAVLRGFMGTITASEGPVTVANGHSTNPRIDLAILRLDPSSDSIIFTVKQGTPASSPSLPSLNQGLTGVFELPLARLNIPAGAGTMVAGYITDCRSWIGTTHTTEGRPGANGNPAPRKGYVGFNATTSQWEYWDGGQWKTLPTTVIDSANKLVAVNNGVAYELIVSPTTPAQSPSVGRIWIKPTS